MMNYTGQRVLVLGLGLTGLSLALWLRNRAAAVTVADTRAAPPMLATLRTRAPDVKVRLGDWDKALFDQADLVAISPGINVNTPMVAAARARHVPFVGDIEVFARELPVAQRVIAITGSNGKSTVTALTGAMCAAAGLRTVVAGNIGVPVLDALRVAEQAGRHPDVYVLELSSFQLETTTSLAPTVAAVLNLSPNHLDWHPNVDDYVRAKSRIFQNGGQQVLNRDDPLTMAMQSEAVVRTFGGGAPAGDRQWGLRERAGGEWLAHGNIDLVPASALALTGRHNALNALAALALANAMGLAEEVVMRPLCEFRGLAHRMSLVAEVRGVAYVDDSKSTTVASTIAALEGMRRKSVLIAGGDAKGQDFMALVPAVRSHARAVVLLGRDAPLLERALRAAGVDLVSATGIEDAVALATDLAHPGDAVLLSPACASWDMFRDYAERGDRFASAVRTLPLEAKPDA
ncbi:MAG: UDP-N-acetylmuramoyl-L-alanine--D-glutamate ligase [Betaproteobacteria bacterium]|nr:UDP-N-acetylmuramoyl-L-alanine--D-glutamate ligase [Betaproteobacteria bacterium]